MRVPFCTALAEDKKKNKPMARADLAVICFVLMTCACLSVVFVWTVWQQVLIDDLRDDTTTTTATTTTTTAAITTAPAPTEAGVQGVNEFQRRIANLRENVIDPMLVKRDEIPRAGPRVVVFPTKKPAATKPAPKPVFQKQVQPEKVVPLEVAFDSDTTTEKEDVKEVAPAQPVAAVRTEAERAARASLAMAENEAKHKVAAARAAEAPKKLTTLQDRLRARANGAKL